MLIRNGLDIVIQHELRDPNGRLLLLKALINDKTYTLTNVYGPNKDAEAIKFFQYLSTSHASRSLKAMITISSEEILIVRWIWQKTKREAF